MPWLNFRVSRTDDTIYWTLGDNPISGDDRMNVEVPIEAVSNTQATERLVAQALQSELCTACDGATINLGGAFGGTGYHDENCQIYYGWTLRDSPWVPRKFTPEPTPEPPTE